jgi:hypothetical protein
VLSPEAKTNSTALDASPLAAIAASTTAVAFPGAVANACAALKTNVLDTVAFISASMMRPKDEYALGVYDCA